METSHIYLDRDQCLHFQIDYMAEGSKATIAADAILMSKLQGYDEEHRRLLEPLGSKSLSLEGLGCGWFKIIELR